MTTYMARGRDSLQSLVDGASRGDSVFITSRYNGRNDSWPIVVDTEIRVEADPHTIIKNRSGEGPTFLLDLDGPNRPPGITMVNVYADANGGNSAFRIQNSRFCNFVGCHAENASGYGFFVYNHDYSPNSNRFFYCSAHSNDGNGFFLDDRAHSTDLVGCRSIGNGGRGLWSQNNYASSWIGGGLERNGSQGAYIDGSEVFTITNAYIEGNANAQNASDQVLFSNAQTGTLSESYINGHDISNTYGVRFFESNNCTVRSVEYRDLNGLVVNDESANTDLQRSTHFSLDGSTFLVEDSGERTLNGGVLEPTDLSSISGQYEGERGINDGTRGPYGLAVWNGGVWISMVDGTRL